MSSACALALVATVTSSASGGGYYLGRALPDRARSTPLRLGLHARCVGMCVLLDSHTQLQANAAVDNCHGHFSR
eukprot:6355642-Prymnesium_polylepis.1